MATRKTLAEILDKLKIKQLNPMQEEANVAIAKNDEILLLSPTGTGKTLAFLLPIIAGLNAEVKKNPSLNNCSFTRISHSD
jgi:ATP-independent RNA helicase DbpA